MSKTTAHRPSQSNQQYVKNSKGETVLNTAYQGNTNNVNDSILSDFSNDFTDSNYSEDHSELLENSLSPELPHDQILDHKVYARSVEELTQESIEDYLEENSDSSLEEALDNVDLGEIAMNSVDGELIYYGDQLKYLEEADDEKLNEIIDEMDELFPNINKSTGFVSTKEALSYLAAEFYKDKYIQENYDEDAYDLDDSQEEAYLAAEGYIEENSNLYDLRNVIKMAYCDEEPFPVDGTQEEKEEFNKWKVEAEQFNDYVYYSYNYKEDDGFYNRKGAVEFKNLSIRDELGKAARNGYQDDAYRVAEQYIDRIKTQLKEK